jgi:hypothetical protein
MICIMVFAEAIIIGRLLPSRFLEQAITGQFYSQIFFLRSGHVNLVRNLLERETYIPASETNHRPWTISIVGIGFHQRD